MLAKVISFFHREQLSGAGIEFVEEFFQEIKRRKRDGKEKEASSGQFGECWEDIAINL
jgi:hypothetical protein